MGNVTGGGVNDGDDDENEFYEVFILNFNPYLLNLCAKSLWVE